MALNDAETNEKYSQEIEELIDKQKYGEALARVKELLK